MIELQGAYASAKIFTDTVDEASLAQVKSLLDQPYVEGSRIRMMPDIHAGAGCTIGTTMTIHDKVCPNLVGVDIGCGMETVRLREDHLELQKLDHLIRDQIPSGFDVRKQPHRFHQEVPLSALCCAKHVNLQKAKLSVGTLGGGNHFIEVDRDDEGNLYLVIHSGSRHLGLEIATYYQNEGWKALTTLSMQEREALIAEMKAAGREKEIQKALKKLGRTGSKKTAIPKSLAYVEGDLLQEYLFDMRLAQEFAAVNRRAMADVLIRGMGLHVEDQITTIHNYIDTENGILRKGAVSAQAGERLLIPINMRDGSLLCTGLGNEDWNCSAPHGAGRLMSRTEAFSSLTLTEFKRQMEGIYSTSVSRDTLDESPMAYKTMDDILNNIQPTARVDRIIRPIYNFKAGGQD